MANIEEEGGEEYELVPRNKIQDLQKQLETIKKSPLAAAPSGSDLVQAMNSLSGNLDTLLNLFKEASEDMKKEERESESVAKKLDPLMEKLDMVIDQNKKIAKAILSVADMIREAQEREGGRPSTMPLAPLPPLPPRGTTYGAMGMPITAPMIPPPAPGFGELAMPEPFPRQEMGFLPLPPAPRPMEVPPPPAFPQAGPAPKKKGFFGR